MSLNSHIRGYLLQLVRASGDDRQIKITKWALRILGRGFVSEFELKELQNMGYKPQ